MSNTYIETTHSSWFTRIKNSFGGALIGLILIIGMVVLLFWNEGRAVQTAKSLAEGAGAVLSVGADSVDAGNEGKLVHVSGAVTTNAIPSDPDFGVKAEGVRLTRAVEMYQWKEEPRSETQRKLGGGEETVTTYTYSKAWDSSHNNSSQFKQPGGHENPSMEIHGQNFQIPHAKLGGFTLDEPVLSLIGGDKALPLKADQRDAVQAAYAGGKKLSIVDNAIYLGWNPSSPVVGDYRIKYEVAPLGRISVIGQQRGDQFVPYQTKAGDRLLMVDAGSVPADRMFKEAEQANTIVTWILRAVGLLLLFIGFTLFMSPFGVLSDVIPFLGSIVRMGTGLIALFLAVVVGTITIAIAWIYYRPLLGIAILVVGALIATGIVYLGRSRRQAAAPLPGGPQPAAPA
jgi:hypothetical protein